MSLIAIRTDASSSIGTGHVSRCLTLSHQLLKHGHEVVFLMRQLAGNMISQVEHQGFRVHVLHTTMAANEELNWTQDAKACKEYLTHQSTPVGWLIVDHYQLDSRWESAINPSVKQIMVIDDLANRQHHCQILLDQNLYHHSETRYRYLLDTNTRQLLGPRYVLLREEFLQLPSLPRNYPKTVSKVIIYYGGSDPTGETLKAMEAFAGGQYKHINFSVVIGASCADYERIKARCAALSNFQFH
ncbi:MAG: UDP-2,4-diacetamido-2,4,6-trideoxy-beta-L-altropyranose hydrolase, partial [Gammaproteobacteria bacterium]|nr:UDP-2,4-diacetamido-2,4,6-trideoxy-beta-L-altropyranose hydrolase [Gammaproteobacteria bacterium]